MATKLQLAPTAPKSSMSAGMSAFFSIADHWRLSTDEARVLLGQPSRSTFFKWKKGHVAQTAHDIDLATRLGHILGIFKSLEILYPSSQLADRWVKEPNLAFGGQSALSRMLAGQITDLAAVRSYLDSVRGGW